MAVFRRGDDAEVTRLADQELGSARADGDPQGEVDALCMLSRVAIRQGDLDEGRALAEQARTIARQAGNPALAQMPLHILAGAARLADDFERARSLAAEAIAAHQALGDIRMLAIEEHNLGHLELNDGQVGRARGLFTSAREHVAKARDTTLLPELALGVAAVAAVDREFARAARLLGAIDSTLSASRRVFDPDDFLEEQTLRAKLEAALGEPAFAEAYRKGVGEDVQQALA
ncbi:hypothetical protein GCM10017788_36090 [Amycolatopsis acidiphila]|nr:hypothetical protein GCM10017788_36090 [Amycolatopsis acidiphila]